MHSSGILARFGIGIWIALVSTVVGDMSFPVLIGADDWPQFMGPLRDSTWREKRIVTTLPAGGPPVVWRATVGAGYSGPAIAAGKVYVMDYVATGGKSTLDFNNRDRIQGRERVLCLDSSTGKQLWLYEYDCPYDISYATGPRCTPTVVDGKVYTLGAEGDLHCFAADSGKILWRKDLKREFRAETPLWGFCSHPLVDGNRLILLVGGKGSVAVALNKDTGKLIWKSLTAREPGYCPPTIIEAGKTRQLLIFHAESINSLKPETGEVYWTVPIAPNFGMSIAAPRLSNNLLFASGIRNEGVVLRLAADRPGAEEVWRGTPTTGVYCASSTPFLHDGMIYGCDCNTGHLRGVRLATGERLWETLVPTSGTERPAPHATTFIVRHEDRYFLFSETGDLIVARLSPQGYSEISRAKLVEPTSSAYGRNVVWSHPAFSNRCIYVRNDQELVCASLAAE